MPIPVTCKCGKQIAAPDNLAGKRAKCPNCSELLQIPAVKKQAGLASQAIVVACSCGKKLSAKPEWVGKAIKCPTCGKPIQVRAAGSAKKQLAKTEVDGGDLSELLDEVDLGQSATGHRCPICRADLLDDDVLCVKCGYNLESGKKMETRSKRRTKATQKAGKTAKAAEKKFDSKIIWLVVLVIALAVVALVTLKPELFS